MSAKRRGPAEPVLAADAPAPKQFWRTATLSLMAVPINVGIMSIVETPSSSRSKFIKVDDVYHPIGMKPYDKVTGEVIAAEDLDKIIKGVETEEGIVEISDDDLALATQRSFKIVQFVDDSALSYEDQRLICPTNYYVIRPGRIRSGRESRIDSGAEHALLLLFSRMKEAGVKAVCTISINDGEPQKMGMLDWTGHLRLISYQNYLRQEPPIGELTATADEVKLFDQLIKAYTRSYIPANLDPTQAQLEQVLEMKSASGQMATPAPQAGGREIPTVDLADAIKAALDAAKTKS